MKIPYIIKQIIVSLIIIVIITSVFFSIKHKEVVKIEPVQKEETVVVPEQKPIDICYYRSTKTSNNFYDVSWLKLSILDKKLTGEFHNIPAEKDSKVGNFEGTVGALDPKIMGHKEFVWWNSSAEGMDVKEELAIIWGDGSATAGFGEMIDRGDGVYVYKDKTKITYIDGMDQIDCATLDEKLFVEKYVRDNIKTISTNKEVLGGSWYVTSVVINPAMKTGEVSYEDGHIQSKANFSYTYEKDSQKISFTKFKIIK